MHAVFQEFLLILIFKFNMLVDIFISSFLVSDKCVEAMINSCLQLLLVIHKLHDFMACIFEVFNGCFVAANDVTVQADYIENVCLPYAQVLDHKTKAGVHFVVLLQSLVHLLCLFLQILDF